MNQFPRLVVFIRVFIFDVILFILLFESFSRHRKLVEFHWSLKDSKFPLVSMTLLSILSDLNNVVVKMVSILSLISNSTCLFSILWGLLNTNQPQLVWWSSSCSTVIFFSFSYSSKIQVFAYLLLLLFLLCGLLGRQNPRMVSSFYLFNQH